MAVFLPGGIITNVQDFVTNVCKGLGLELSQ